MSSRLILILFRILVFLEHHVRLHKTSIEKGLIFDNFVLYSCEILLVHQQNGAQRKQVKKRPHYHLQLQSPELLMDKSLVVTLSKKEKRPQSKAEDQHEKEDFDRF